MSSCGYLLDSCVLQRTPSVIARAAAAVGVPGELVAQGGEDHGLIGVVTVGRPTNANVAFLCVRVRGFKSLLRHVVCEGDHLEADCITGLLPIEVGQEVVVDDVKLCHASCSA
jgi:hypothetical protein